MSCRRQEAAICHVNNVYNCRIKVHVELVRCKINDVSHDYINGQRVIHLYRCPAGIQSNYSRHIYT